MSDSQLSHVLEARLRHWLLQTERLEASPQDFVHGLVGQLLEAGVQLLTCSALIRTLHPQLELFGLRWRPARVEEIQSTDTRMLWQHSAVPGPRGVVDVYAFAHGHTQERLYKTSPFYALTQQAGPIRWRAEDPNKPLFPILAELLDRGASDYLAISVPIQAPFVAGLSFATSQPGGFPSGFQELLQRLQPLLGLVLGFNLERLSMAEILAAYLGRHAAQRVLGGQFRRGQSDRVQAVIGFAKLAGPPRSRRRMDDAHTLQALHLFFRQVNQAVSDNNGEILKFDGDTVLVAFGLEEHKRASCADDAVHAMKQLLEASQETGPSADKHQSPAAYAALSLGEVLLGNIGSERRLDFTVMGQAVNLASRLHQLCIRLQEPLILSSDLAAAVSVSTHAIGQFKLKGIAHEQEVHVASE